jgi:cytochrome P450
MIRIAADRGRQARLRAAPEVIPATVDELLRLETPVQAVPRWTAQDADVAGRRVCAGEKLMLLLVSANRDPEQFRIPTHAYSSGGRTGTWPSDAD